MDSSGFSEWNRNWNIKRYRESKGGSGGLLVGVLIDGEVQHA